MSSKTILDELKRLLKELEKEDSPHMDDILVLSGGPYSQLDNLVQETTKKE